MASKSRYLKGRAIVPELIAKNARIVELVDDFFQAFNAGRLRGACQLFVKKYLVPDVTVGMTITGALTPAGLGGSCIVPLMKAGFVDWIVSTGANLYHDTHFAIGKTLHQGSPFIDDRVLRREGVIRIYDILFDYDVLLSTDAFYRKIIMSPEFQKPLSTAEFHFKVGKYVYRREKALGIKRSSVLASATNMAEAKTLLLLIPRLHAVDIFAHLEMEFSGAQRLLKLRDMIIFRSI